MDLTVLTNKVAELSADAATKATKITDLEAQLAAKVAEIAALTARVDELQTTANADVQDLKKKVDESNALVADATSFLTEQAKAALTASGQTGDAPSTITDAISVIKASGKNLVNLLVPGGVAVSADSQAKGPQTAHLGAFKTNRA